MTPLVLLMDMLQSRGFKILAAIVVIFIVIGAISGIIETRLRITELKQRIKLNKRALAQ